VLHRTHVCVTALPPVCTLAWNSMASRFSHLSKNFAVCGVGVVCVVCVVCVGCVSLEGRLGISLVNIYIESM
jgi:hypothetical protein